MPLILWPSDFANVLPVERDIHIVEAYAAARECGTLVQGATAPAGEDRVVLVDENHGELIAYTFPTLVLIWGPLGFLAISEGEGIEVPDLDDPLYEEEEEEEGGMPEDMTADDWARFNREADGEEEEEEEEGEEEEDGGGYVDADDVWYEANLQTAAPVHSPYTGTGLLFTGTVAELLTGFAQLEAAKEIDEVMDRMGLSPERSGIPRLYGACTAGYPAKDVRAVIVLQGESEPCLRYTSHLGDLIAAFESMWGGEFDNWVIDGEFYPAGHAKNLLQCPLVLFTFGRHGNRKQD